MRIVKESLKEICNGRSEVLPFSDFLGSWLYHPLSTLRKSKVNNNINRREVSIEDSKVNFKVFAMHQVLKS